MDKEWLENELNSGRSIESLAREVGRDASTVSYWVRKHGLRSSHADKHTPRGRLTRETLITLVEAGLSAREIADAVDRSQTTVWYWLREYGLMTAQATTKRTLKQARDRKGIEVEAQCPVHGWTKFVCRGDGLGHRCLKCRAAAVIKRRRTVKRILVDEAGGRCELCGYCRCIGALQFHHRNPAEKSFGIAFGGAARSIARAREEAAKCVLLCANCHAEVEAGVASLPEDRDAPAA